MSLALRRCVFPSCCARATQHLFYRVGRAMIKPIFAQKASQDGHVGLRLEGALRWWIITLERGVAERRPWKLSEAPPCKLHVDAASTPARLAGVLFCDGSVQYFDVAPSKSIMQQLAQRRDGQITSLVRLSHLRVKNGHASDSLAGDPRDNGCALNLLQHTVGQECGAL